MSRPNLRTKITTADNRFQAWRSGFASATRGITLQPPIRFIGTADRARDMARGEFTFAGEMISAPATSPWDLTASEAVMHEIHGFGWLDDFAAAGDPGMRSLAQTWLADWIARYSTAKGPGWVPHLTGRRLIRWITHAPFILKGHQGQNSQLFLKALGRQSAYLAKAWPDAGPGLPRFEALTGLLYAALSLEGSTGLLKGALKGLAREIASLSKDGSIASRNPEELLGVFACLIWAAAALEESGNTPSLEHLAAIAAIAPILRSLRMGDGSLARFHGGGRGADGLLEQCLADSRVRDATRQHLAMGYGRLSAGRTILIMDAGSPAKGSSGIRAHASPLAFEMSSGRRPMIVNQGPGDAFGTEWRAKSRETSAHSALVVGDTSCAKFAPYTAFGHTDRETLLNGAELVSLERAIDRAGTWLLASHDGYVSEFGMHHERRLYLTPDGRELRGEDTISAQSSRAQARFARHRQDGGLKYQTRFHVHPDVAANVDMGGEAIRLTLKSGENWIFRQSGGELGLEASTYLDQRRINPRLTQQIVVRADAMDFSSRINWVFKRTEDGSRHTRDIVPDPLPL